LPFSLQPPLPHCRHPHPPSPPHLCLPGSEDIQLGKNESLRDTAIVLGRFSDLVLARVFGHGDIEELSRHCGSPVINALSDQHHPLQLLADMQTLEEEFGSVQGLTIAWVGDGNNILHSFLSSAGALGYNVQYATPPGFEPKAAVVAAATALAHSGGVRISGSHDPLQAVQGADVIVTDTWVSMGQEGEVAARMRAFEGYQVTEAMAKRGGAKPRWVFLHCLPRKPQEVDEEVFYGPRTRVWDEAENRKWTFQAVALALAKGGVHL
jgi:ornithine carbamoyltransferase